MNTEAVSPSSPRPPGVLALVRASEMMLIAMQLTDGDCRKDTTLHIESTESAQSTQSRIADWIGQHHASGWPVVLAFDNCWAHLFAFEVEAFSTTAEAAAFRLESELMLDAEAMTVAVRSDGGLVRCLAVDHAPLNAWIGHLETAGLPVHSIVPNAFAAIQQLSTSDVPDANDSAVSRDQVWVIPKDEAGSTAGDSWVELVYLRDGLPTAWSRCRDNDVEIEREIRMQMQSIPNLNSADKDNWERVLRRASVVPNLNHALALAAESIFRGTIQPWFQCRRGELARHDPIRTIRPALQRLAVAASIGFMILTILMILRAGTLQSLKERSESAAATAFHQTFPGQRMPTSPMRQLRGERRKWVATALAAKSGNPQSMSHRSMSRHSMLTLCEVWLQP